jgi:hypothetical protein
MKKISSRDIQLLVAGALALAGFRALVWIPYYFVVSTGVVRIVGAVVTGLALPIGIGIFSGRTSAILWAQIYLWLVLISGCIVIPVFWHSFPEKVEQLALSIAPEMLVAAVLLGLIFWSNSERFRHEPNA